MPVRFEAKDGIAHITLDRPESLNAIDPELHRDLVAAWNRLRDDASLRVAVLAGSGDRAFCAGVDIKRMAELYQVSPGQSRRDAWDHAPGIGGITRNLDAGKPVIASIHGYCYGGGLELALACDLRVASEDARFALPEVNWAIIPGQGGTQRLPRNVPTNIALEMILTGEPISAERAYQLGLVNRVVPRTELGPTAERMAQKIAGFSPEVVRRARESVLRGVDLPLVDGLRLEQELADPLRDSPENRAARARFARSNDRSGRSGN